MNPIARRINDSGRDEYDKALLAVAGILDDLVVRIKGLPEHQRPAHLEGIAEHQCMAVPNQCARHDLTASTLG